ncbi:MAG: GGDEF domain-containing protein, partial [Planctomycetes bacterium]|nr:GGDEF domain-containing protein [Planctomycetota bacterium]
MPFLPAAIGTFLLVNLLCACVALGVGFVAGIWFFGAKLANPANDSSEKTPASKLNEEAKRSAERAAMAAGRVADLAKNVASDVGDHAAKIKAISADLAGIDRQSTEANGTVFTALDQMLAANSELQERLAKAEQQLAAQAVEIKVHESEARTDSLTGLSNRRAFDDELKRRLSEWQRKRIPCSLVLLDIDFFKRFNDTHGHQIGDEVLRQVAKVLKAQSRDSDLPCRYGGEEFGVILPTTDAASARLVAERIRAAVEASVTVCEGKSLKVTCSVGLSQFESSDDVGRLIRRADEALYASKNAGRNCGHWQNGGKCVPLTAPIDESPENSAPAPTMPEAPDDPRSTSGATFIQILKRRVTESHRFGIPLSVMHLSIEEYDVVTQKYGSGFARKMSDIAEPALNKALSESDVVAKLDLGEFVVMLPGKTKTEASLVA